MTTIPTQSIQWARSTVQEFLRLEALRGWAIPTATDIAFGLRLDLVPFILASAAILYPVWPFIIAADRALHSGVANTAVLVVLGVGTGYLFSVCNPVGLHPARALARNAQGRAHPKPSARSWIWRPQRQPFCVTARSWRVPTKRSGHACILQ